MSRDQDAAFVVTLSQALRQAGLPVSPENSLVAAGALQVSRPLVRDRVYWATRLSFVSTRAQIPVFDRVFAGVFDHQPGPDGSPPPTPGEADPGAERERLRASGVGTPPDPERPIFGAGWARLEEDGRGSEREGGAAAIAAASPEERLRRRNFDQLSSAELAQLRQMMASLTVSLPPRRARRVRRAPSGERLDLRQTLRRSARRGGFPARLAWRQRLQEPRRLVVICDISGSMEPYARAYLQFLQSAVGAGSAEAFVFATRLTRLTKALRRAPLPAALQRASAVAPDWSGGTRIAASLERFNRLYGRKGMARGAVVVILSDGWEIGDPQALAREMAVLSRLAHRIIWVNPHKASRGFAPLTRGMAAALPFCDHFASGHSLAAMGEVVEAISGSR